jgi:hypothetical protein
MKFLFERDAMTVMVLHVRIFDPILKYEEEQKIIKIGVRVERQANKEISIMTTTIIISIRYFGRAL